MTTDENDSSANGCAFYVNADGEEDGISVCLNCYLLEKLQLRSCFEKCS